MYFLQHFFVILAVLTIVSSSKFDNAKIAIVHPLDRSAPTYHSKNKSRQLIQNKLSRSLPPSRLSSWFGHYSYPILLSANRQSGTISVINANKPNRTSTINLGRGAEPMYISADIRNRQFWIADRATNKLIKFKYTLYGFVRQGSFSTANGTFHTIATQDDRTLFPLAWTSCDADRVTTVHLMTNGKRLATIPTPQFIENLGGFPHDLTASFRFGFISYLGASTGRGYIACYDAFNFKRLSILKVAQDPHVAIRGNSKLFVVSQGGDSSLGRVYMISVPDLKIMAFDRQPSPHGIFVSFDELLVYVTNIAEGGNNAVVVYSAITLKRLNCGNITTPFAVPHNIAQSYDMSKLYITHSSPDTGAVSVFKLDSRGCPIQSSVEVEHTGLLAFGITPFAPQLKIWRYFN